MADVAFYGVELDALDPDRIARFWAGVLGWSVRDVDDVIVVAGSGYPILVRATDTAKVGQNRIHLDLTSSSPEAMQATISRALDLGARPVDIGQTEADRHEVLADPEGNEFCVIESGNNFLAGTGVVGAINCDGTQQLGYFWREALGWPLVWDQDEETAIQAPSGGSKITWSGPPLMPRHGRDRWRLVLAVRADLDAAVSRLVALGATLLSTSDDRSEAVLSDLDGNEFGVVVRTQ